jgi:alpha-beta hydrolase superfamily lysophospholipase
MNKEIDVRHVLPAIRVPALILHGTDDTVVEQDQPRKRRKVAQALGKRRRRPSQLDMRDEPWDVSNGPSPTSWYAIETSPLRA